MTTQTFSCSIVSSCLLLMGAVLGGIVSVITVSFFISLSLSFLLTFEGSKVIGCLEGSKDILCRCLLSPVNQSLIVVADNGPSVSGNRSLWKSVVF